MTMVLLRRLGHLLWPIGFALMLGATLGACTADRDFPSLARRPAERLVGTVTPVSDAGQPAPAAASGEITGRLAQLQDSARTAHGRFAARRAAAERAAAAAGPLGSESWAAASVALAALDEAHDQESTVLAAIDQLQVDQQVADAGVSEPDLAAIAAARDEIAAAADADGAVAARLSQRLAR